MRLIYNNLQFTIYSFWLAVKGQVSIVCAAHSARGQALVTLLFFVVIAITITSAAIFILYSNSLSGTRFQQGSIAYEIAQSGVENAILRLLRDPNYTGEVLSVGDGSATIQVVNNGGGSYTVTSKGTIGNLVKQIRVNLTYSNSQLTITSQSEVF